MVYFSPDRQQYLIACYEQKSTGDDGCGTWVFEGYLHSRSTFAGRWSTLSALGQEGIGGIFSVSKTAQ